MEKYTLNDFNTYLINNNTPEKIVDYFKEFNFKYEKLKEEGSITDELMYNLTDFWLGVNDYYKDSLINILMSSWQKEPPEVVKDIVAYTPKFHEQNFNAYCTKLDKIEQKEVELLFHEIWDRAVRTEVRYAYLDWDSDMFYENEFTLPKYDREDYEYTFKEELAKLIYNRGNMLIKLYSNRGIYDIVGIKVNGKGVWRCLSLEELETEYFNEDGSPFSLSEDERVIKFDVHHTLYTSDDGKLIHYKF